MNSRSFLRNFTTLFGAVYYTYCIFSPKLSKIFCERKTLESALAERSERQGSARKRLKIRSYCPLQVLILLGFQGFLIMELVTGIGPVTPTLPRWCSTAEPHQQMLFFDWFLRWIWVIKKCRFCFTKVVLYPWATVA